MDRLGDWLRQFAVADAQLMRRAAEEFVASGRSIEELDEPGAALAAIVLALAKERKEA